MYNPGWKWSPMRWAARCIGMLLMLYAASLRFTTLPNALDVTQPHIFWVWLSDLTGVAGLMLMLKRLKTNKLDDYTLGEFALRGAGIFLALTGIFIRLALSPNLLRDGLLRTVLESDLIWFAGFLLVFGPRQTFAFIKNAYLLTSFIVTECIRALLQALTHLVTGEGSIKEPSE